MELFLILVSLMVVTPPKIALSLSVKSKLNPRVVPTRYGKIQGLTQTFEDRKYLQPIDVYLGIPYATPPIGSNRFSPTRAPRPWDGVKMTDRVGFVCPQKLPNISNEQEALERMPRGRYEYLMRLLPHLRNQSEDCLYLNVYGPAMGSALPGNIVAEVESFYNDDTVSANMPGMKDFVSVRDAEGKRIHVQKRLLLANLKELYANFKSSHPDSPVGFSKFASLRPKHCISAGATGTHTSCVCITHQNMKLMLLGSTNSSRKHPVLMFIHGESYDWGSGNPYDGSVLASYTDQVIVTINYRLGVLGFLNANMIRHSKAQLANYGLMDQIAALQWVQENIDLFGGNPTNVTLMGHGTGAACVNFLAISPTVPAGLFKRTILLSGSALSSWAVVEDPVMYALKLARGANCTIPTDLLKDHELIVDCLRKASLDELLLTDTQPPTFLSAFGPSVDGVVIMPDFQKDLLSYLGPEFQGSGQLPKRADHGAPITSNNKYDLLFGVTSSEALWRFAEKDVQIGFEGERRDRIIRTYVRNAYTYHLTEIFYTVVNEYTDWERTSLHPKNTRDACVQALSDAQFVAPLVQTGDLFTLRHSKEPNNPHIKQVPDSEKEPMPQTFFYVFDHQMKGSYPEKMGTVHGEELPFIFGAPLVDGFGHFPRNYTKNEIALSESIIQNFANFVRTGNPNSATSPEQHHRKNEGILPISQEKNKYRTLTWEKYDPVHQKYLEISLRPRQKNHYRAHQMSVWLRLVPELHRAGMEDVEPRHNLFRGHGDPSLYDGSVRPDPLSRVGDEFTRRGNVTTESPSTTDFSITTCVSLIQSTNLQNVHNASTDTLASLDAAGYSAYSTALSVTVAIGCSLLILNVLVFAGMHYRRDKTRLEAKTIQQQQMLNVQCDPRSFTELKQPPPPHSHFSSGGQVIVDVENEMLRRNVMKGVPNDQGLMQQGQSTHTLPHQHHYQHQKQHNQQHATLPRSSVMQEMSMQGPPNGSIHLKVPRAPPPPRAKSPPENQPLLQGATVSSRVSQANMSEMRV